MMEREIRRGGIQPWGKLVATHGFQSTMYLCEGKITLGRHASCTLPVNRREISGFHCQILKSHDKDEIVLKDISKNGTMLITSDPGNLETRETALQNRDISISHGAEVILAMPRTPPDDEKISFIFTKLVKAHPKGTSTWTNASFAKVNEPISQISCPDHLQTRQGIRFSPILAPGQEHKVEIELNKVSILRFATRLAALRAGVSIDAVLETRKPHAQEPKACQHWRQASALKVHCDSSALLDLQVGPFDFFTFRVLLIFLHWSRALELESQRGRTAGLRLAQTKGWKTRSATLALASWLMASAMRFWKDMEAKSGNKTTPRKKSYRRKEKNEQLHKLEGAKTTDVPTVSKSQEATKASDDVPKLLQVDSKKEVLEDKKNCVLMERQIGTVRTLAADIVQRANCGHPGAPMGMAAMAHVLWGEIMRYAPQDPDWIGRDRFVLSNGHSCALQYLMMFLTGYDSVGMEDLQNFRVCCSRTPGHPERHCTKGIEVSTGPLGQGISNAIGMAIAEKHMAAKYNKPGFEIFDNYTYVLCGDGCMQEGVASEACSLAGHLGLGKLIVLYDDNNITIDGDTSLSFTEDVGLRFEAYGWQVLEVLDANRDTKAIMAAIKIAQQEKHMPTIIKCKTVIGFGSSKEGTHEVHGAPLGTEDVAKVKERFGFDPNVNFHVPPKVLDAYRMKKKEGNRLVAEWASLFSSYKEKYPTEAAEIERRFAGKLPDGWEKVLPRYTPEDKPNATRSLSGSALNALAEVLPELVGGSADLTPSNKLTTIHTQTKLNCTGDFQRKTPEGRYLRFGVREHGMGAIGNGLHAYGGIIPFTATFLTFIEYMFPAVRLAALSAESFLISGHKHIYIMTHDSLGIGEDGPTHQPIEQVNMVRMTPNVLMFRPADGNETSGAYKIAMEQQHTPSVFALSRQLDGSSIENVAKGAYTLREQKDPDAILIATGSEVSTCLEAAKLLGNIGVVSMPCAKLFDEQSLEYRRQVLPFKVPIIAVEAAAASGWYKYAHHTIVMRTFGVSGKGSDCMEYFGFVPEKIAVSVREWLEKSGAKIKEHGFTVAAQFEAAAKRDLHYIEYITHLPKGNQFDALNKFTKIVADTGDIEAIKKYKPVDATTNPSLILSASKLPAYKHLVSEAVEYARSHTICANISEQVSLAMDRLAVNFGVEISKIVPGVVSTEVDARLSFDTEATVAKARSLVKMYRERGVNPTKKVLIKIASTWEGIKAAEILEKEGIHCNMTLLFSMCQAVACAEVGATLISPFVGRIMDWYAAKEGKEWKDGKGDPGVESVTKIYNYYKKFGYKTIVMGASFRNRGQIIELAGCDKLTIGPKFLQQMSESTDPILQKLAPTSALASDFKKISIDKKTFRFMLNEDAMATEKLAEGIRKFAAASIELETIIRKHHYKPIPRGIRNFPMNQLESLQQYTIIVADTGDIEAIKKYKPVDATTNPSLILSASKLPAYKHLVSEAVEYAKSEGKGSSLEAIVSLAMDRLAVNFGVEISKIVPGVVSTEVDARLSFDTEATVAKARSLVKMYRERGVNPTKKVLIKIASTWEGIKAAEILEKEGIHCNMTLLFSMCQAVACAEVGATLISPFVGRIMDWYAAKEGKEWKDGKGDPGVESVTKIYNYYKKFGYKTIVMGASFRNRGQIIELAGCDKLTIGPKFLQQMSECKEPLMKRLSKNFAEIEEFDKMCLDKKTFRFMLNEDAMATDKLAEGIRKFAAASIELEGIIRGEL
eukprot:jgi/Bigna1/86430/estExt_fgenesh1_pg.C_100228